MLIAFLHADHRRVAKLRFQPWFCIGIMCRLLELMKFYFGIQLNNWFSNFLFLLRKGVKMPFEHLLICRKSQLPVESFDGLSINYQWAKCKIAKKLVFFRFVY